VKLLGVILGKKLRAVEHINYLRAKMHKILNLLPNLAGSSWGLAIRTNAKSASERYLPCSFYGLSLWFVPGVGWGFKDSEERVNNLLRIIQLRSARMISGAFTRTSGDALNIELWLTRIEDKLTSTLQATLLRIATNRSVIEQIDGTRDDIPRRLSMQEDPQQCAFSRLSPLSKTHPTFPRQA